MLNVCLPSKRKPVLVFAFFEAFFWYREGGKDEGVYAWITANSEPVLGESSSAGTKANLTFDSLHNLHTLTTWQQSQTSSPNALTATEKSVKELNLQ
jgi:hypothetical protein